MPHHHTTIIMTSVDIVSTFCKMILNFFRMMYIPMTLKHLTTKYINYNYNKFTMQQTSMGKIVMKINCLHQREKRLYPSKQKSQSYPNLQTQILISPTMNDNAKCLCKYIL